MAKLSNFDLSCRVVDMPVAKCGPKKWKIGSGKCMYKSKASAERAYGAYRAKAHSEQQNPALLRRANDISYEESLDQWGLPLTENKTPILKDILLDLYPRYLRKFPRTKMADLVWGMFGAQKIEDLDAAQLEVLRAHLLRGLR
jgi:hypothetical protein